MASQHFNPYEFNLTSEMAAHGMAVAKKEIVVRVWSIWMPIVLMMSSCGIVLSLLLGPLGLMLIIPYALFVLLPVSGVVILSAAWCSPKGVTRKEASHIGMRIGAIASLVPLVVFGSTLISTVGASPAFAAIIGIVAVVMIGSQILAGSWGAKAGFDHFINLVSLGRPNVWGRILNER